MKYQFRTEMVVEAITIKNMFTWLFSTPKRAKVFVLQYNIIDEEEEDNNG